MTTHPQQLCLQHFDLLSPGKLTYKLCGGTNGFPWVLLFDGCSAVDLRISFDSFIFKLCLLPSL